MKRFLSQAQSSSKSQAQSSFKSQSQLEAKSRRYLTWNPQMDTAMAKALYDQMNAGNKGDGDWKPQAYQAVVDELNATLQLGLTKENVKNRLRAWKKHYAIVTDIKSQSGLTWDEEKKMVPISAENLSVWNDYCESHLAARGYQNKVIDNWDDIVMLCGKDRATGEGAEDVGNAEHMMEAEEENEGDFIPNSHASTHPATSTCDSHPYKKKKKDPVAQAIGDVANTLKEFMASQVTKQLIGEEVHKVVSDIPNLNRLQVFKAVRILMAGNPEEFSLLKSLSDAEKTEWVRMLICQSEGMGNQ